MQEIVIFTWFTKIVGFLPLLFNNEVKTNSSYIMTLKVPTSRPVQIKSDNYNNNYKLLIIILIARE